MREERRGKTNKKIVLHTSTYYNHMHEGVEEDDETDILVKMEGAW